MKRKKRSLRVIICGTSGAGKTYVLEQLKRQLPEQQAPMLFDLDQVVAQAVGVSPQQLGQWIEQNGMEEFRKQELTQLQRLLELPQIVVALGAGALTPELMQLLHKTPQLLGLWLKVDFEICWQRICTDANRPLVKLGKERMQKLYLEREQQYRQFLPLTSTEQMLVKLMSLLTEAE